MKAALCVVCFDTPAIVDRRCLACAAREPRRTSFSARAVRAALAIAAVQPVVCQAGVDRGQLVAEAVAADRALAAGAVCPAAELVEADLAWLEA